MNARGIIAILLAVWILIVANSATAHPLGNFSISQYSGIRVSKDAIELRYLIDMAEIPTFQEIQESGIAPKAENPSLEDYLTRKSELLRDGLKLQVNDQPLVLRAESKEIIFPPGAGGLPTMKIGILYKAKLRDSKTGEFRLSYRDDNFPGRAGWKEIIAVGEAGARILNSSVPQTDRSSQLNNYPTDLLNTPPQVVEARVAFTTAPIAGSLASADGLQVYGKEAEKVTNVSKLQVTRLDVAQGLSKIAPAPRPMDTTILNSGAVDAESPRADQNSPVQLHANRPATPRNSFTELMATKQLGPGIILIALAVALGLGAFHALEPGHGKTLVAAYLVGARGTMKHAFLLGLIVTAAHTVGVYLLGAVTLYASQYIVPERLYPWLGVASGIMITGLGAVLLVRRYLDRDAFLSHHHHHHASHTQGSDHQHHGHTNHARKMAHGHHPCHGDQSHDHYGAGRDVSLRELLALGVSGGIVPCPAALVVLLSAVSMQRLGFGLLLIVAFSIGLAAVLIAIGLLMVYARGFISRFQRNDRVFTRWLPLASSTIITLFGFGLVIQAVASTGYFFS
jgi:nickel/cobalt exporter